jgi:hypothetical protein
VLTSMVEGCGVVVVPSSAGEDANADFQNLAALISMTNVAVVAAGLPCRRMTLA